MSNWTQKERAAYSRGVVQGAKAERVRQMVAERGVAYCQKPGCTYEVAEHLAMSMLHFHHEDQKSLTARANPFTSFGGDHPDNLFLLCPFHHAGEHD